MKDTDNNQTIAIFILSVCALLAAIHTALHDSDIKELQAEVVRIEAECRK